MNTSKISAAFTHGIVAAALLYSLATLALNGGAQVLVPASRIAVLLALLASLFSAMATSLHAECIKKILPGSLQNRINLAGLARCIGLMLAVSLYGIFLYCSLFMIGPFAPKGMPLTVFSLILACAAIPLVWVTKLLPKTRRWATLAGVAAVCLIAMIVSLVVLYFSREIRLAFTLYAVIGLGIVVIKQRSTQQGIQYE